MNLKGGAKVSVRRFTPKQAQVELDKLAETPHVNRKAKAGYAEAIASAWERGEWIQTGDTIKFNENGDLMDGQHRMQAVVISDRTTEFVVVEGISSDAIRVIDAELAKRSLADQLGIEGFRNTVPLASVVRAGWAFELKGSPQIGGSQSRSLTMAEALDFIERRPSIEASAVAGLKFKGRESVGITAREYGTLWDIMFHINPSTTTDFFDQISFGYGGEKGSPVTRLRTRINAHEAQDGQHSIQYVMGIFIKAWNAEVEGRNLRSLKMEKDETFPAINGFEKWLADGGVL